MADEDVIPVTEREELKRCKCGCASQSRWRHLARGHVIRCNDVWCGHEANGIDAHSAIAAWNRRAEG